MPTQGSFSAALVDATNRTILQERVDASGIAWVTGEPGDEFFVAVAQTEHVSCAIKTYVAVDGVDIGYGIVFPSTAPCELPLMGPMASGQTWSDGTALVTHAFKFLRHEVKGAAREQDEATGERRVPLAGHVTVRLVRTIKTDRPVVGLALDTWSGDSSVGPRRRYKKDQSELRATIGHTVGTIGCAAPLHYDDQEELACLTIHYTTDFGIAVRGLYTREEANGSQRPPPKRVRRERGAPTGASAKDAIVF